MCIFGERLMRINDIISEDINEGPVDWTMAKMGNKNAQARQDVKKSDKGEVKRMVGDFMAKSRGKATPAILAKYLSAAGFPVDKQKIHRVLQLGKTEFMKNQEPVAQQAPTQSVQAPTQSAQKPQTGDKKNGYTFQGLQWTKDSTKRIASKAERKSMGLDESTLVEAKTLSKGQVKKVIDYFVKKGGRENIAPSKRSKNAYGQAPAQAPGQPAPQQRPIKQSSDKEMLATLNKAASILSKAGISGVRVVPDND
jgi:hypothetical protein